MDIDGSKAPIQNERFETAINEIRNLYESMLISENKGDYVQAQSIKRNMINKQKKLDQFNLSQMQNNHNNQIVALQTEYNENLAQCNSIWSNKLDQYMQSCRRQTQNTDKNNKQQIKILRVGLQEKLPTKVKQSYQLLNLREMEHHMSKQKNFPQAQLIQDKIKNLYNEELEAWNNDRNAKIQQAVNNLKAKHSKDRDLFNKKMQIQLQDYNNEWHQQKIYLSQKFQNNFKQLKAYQQRQALSYKKYFKTKGGIFSQKYKEGLSQSINL